MFKARSPVVLPEFLEHLDDAGRRERLILWRDAGKRIESPRRFRVGRINKDDVVCAAQRHERQQGTYEVTMRVEQ